MNNNTEVLLRQIWNVLQNTSSGGSTANVDITGNSVGLATGSDISTLQTSLNSSLNSLLIQLNAINGNTDLIETLQTNTNNLLTLTNSYVDGVEGLLTTLGSNTDNLETLLTALGLNTDNLETLLGIGNTLQTTANTSLNNIDIDTSNIDLKLANVLTSLSNILTKLSDNTQTTRITDGTDTLAINPDGSINTTSTNTILTKEQELNFGAEESIYAYTIYRTRNINGNIISTSAIINDEPRTMPIEQKFALQQVFKSGVVDTRKVIDNPNVGDTTYYIAYNRNAINRAVGNVNLADPLHSIERIITDVNGNTSRRWANNQKYKMDLIFDDGSQNYLTYTYS